MERGQILWEPTGEPTRLDWFMEATGHRSWPELLEWSITDLDGFWRSIAVHLDVRWHTPPTDGIALADASMPGAVWFPGATLNYVSRVSRARPARKSARP